MYGWPYPYYPPPQQQPPPKRRYRDRPYRHSSLRRAAEEARDMISEAREILDWVDGIKKSGEKKDDPKSNKSKVLITIAAVWLLSPLIIPLYAKLIFWGLSSVPH